MTQYTSEQKTTEDTKQAHNAFLIAALLAVAHFVTVAYYLYLIQNTGIVQFYTLVVISSALGVLLGIGAVLSRRGRPTFGIILVLGALAVSYPLIATLVIGLGLTIGIALMFAGPIIAFQVLPRRSGWVMTVATVVSGLTTLLLDVFGSKVRPSLPGIVIQIVAASVVVILGYFIVRQFRNFPLRTKIILAILVIEGISIGVLAYFALTRANQIITSVSSKFENSVQVQIEAQLTNIVKTEAMNADQLFSATKDSLIKLADYRAQLESQNSILGQGAYWDAHTKLSILPEGQYGNPDTDIASVFLPKTIIVNDEIQAELNTSAYLDFFAPGILKTQPQIVAVYYISALGSTTYYPNINLATLVPEDFDALGQPFYTIADPQSNPERIPRWTEPYQDPAGTGLIVTSSTPVYNAAGGFKGVIGIDMQLARISETISQIKIGETGFAFLVGETGHILAMPPEGYAIFGLQPEEVPINETPKETILGQGSEDLQAITIRLTNGESGLSSVAIDGVETYVAFAPLNTPGYSLGVIVPVNELNTAIVASQEEIQNDTASSLQTATFILIGLLVGAILLSLGIGQIIAAPLTRLTQTAEKISSGDLSARAVITSQDETGILARAFNRMTDQLRETLSGLEQRVADRTKDLATVAEVGTATATILETDRLLQEVVELTKERFKLYHSHIYLLDQAGENLVLASGAGEPGRQMVAEKRSIPLDREQSLVARAARERKGVIVNDVTEAPDFLPNPLLPDTRSELAVPMIVGGNVIGVFDVQSDQVGRFTDSDINIQTTLAAQVATSIQNVRSFEQSKAQADLESLVNSIGQKIQRATSVDETLQTAIREIGLALGASRVSANIGAGNSQGDTNVNN